VLRAISASYQLPTSRCKYGNSYRSRYHNDPALDRRGAARRRLRVTALQHAQRRPGVLHWAWAEWRRPRCMAPWPAAHGRAAGEVSAPSVHRLWSRAHVHSGAPWPGLR